MKYIHPLLALSLTTCTIQHYHPPTVAPKQPQAHPKPAAPVAKKHATAAKKPQARPTASRRPTTRPHTAPVRVAVRIPPPPSPEDVIFAPPPTITFSERDLGTPYTAEFQAYRGADGRSVFPKGKITTEQRTRYEGSVLTIDSEQALRAHAGAWGVQVSGGTASGSRFAAQRALQIDRCSWVDDRTAMRNAPPAAVYYPAAVCFGHRYEAVLEGSVNQFTTGVKASFLIFSAGLDAFAKQHRLKLDIKADGLIRKEGCDNLVFRNDTAFEACFTASNTAATPIWVEWRVIPGRKPPPGKINWKPSRVGNCAGTGENCRPCQSWKFESLSFSDEGSDFGSSGDIRIVITEPNGAERKLYGSSPSFKDRPIYAAPGDVIRFYAYDEDLFVDDPLGTGFINVQEFHRDGRAASGRLTAIGVCER